jgi:hypothetical protein
LKLCILDDASPESARNFDANDLSRYESTGAVVLSHHAESQSDESKSGRIDEDVRIEFSANGNYKCFMLRDVTTTTIQHSTPIEEKRNCFISVELDEDDTLLNRHLTLTNRSRRSSSYSRNVKKLLELIPAKDEHIYILILGRIMRDYMEKYLANTMIKARGEDVYFDPRSDEFFIEDYSMRESADDEEDEIIVPTKRYKCGGVPRDSHIINEVKEDVSHSDDTDFRGENDNDDHICRNPYHSHYQAKVVTGTLQRTKATRGMHLFDSACNMSCTGDISLFTTLDLSPEAKTYELEIADGTIMKSDGVGYIGKLKVLYIKRMGLQCLLSTSQICAAGYRATFTNNGFEVVNTNGEVLLDGTIENGMYLANLDKLVKSVKDGRFMAKMTKVASIQYEHDRLGHCGNTMVRNAVEKDLCDGLHVTTRDLNVPISICDHCQIAKSKVVHFKEEAEHVVTRLGELVHMDLQGPLPQTLRNQTYLCCITERGSNMFWVYPCKDKTEDTMIQIVEHWHTYEVMANRQVIKNIRTDVGGEWKGESFNELLAMKGIRHQYSQPRNPQQNAHVERKFAFGNSRVRALLHQFKVIQNLNKIPEFLWDTAYHLFRYVTVRITSSNLRPEISAYEHWHGERPSVQHLLVYGQTVYIHDDEHVKRKFIERADKGVYVGCVEGRSPGHLVYLPQAHTTSVVRNLRADINHYMANNNVKLFDKIEEKVNQEVTDPTPEEPRYNLRKKAKISHVLSKEDALEKAIVSMEGRTMDSFVLPKDYQEAISCPDAVHWIKAKRRESDSLDRRSTFGKLLISDIAGQQKLLGTKDVLKFKFDFEKNIVEFKWRLVAQGYSQKEGIDYDEKFSPVVRMDTFRVMLALCARYKWEIHMMDVDSAYLNGELKHDIYCKIPTGYRTTDKVLCTRDRTLVGDPQTECFKILKPIYGLVQAGRQWNERIVNYILNVIKYKRATNDLSLFIYNYDVTDDAIRLRNYVLIYVDDILIFGENIEEIKRVKTLLNKEFEMKDLKDIKQFLGMKVERDMKRGVICVSAIHYIQKLISDFGLECNISYPPLKLPLNLYNKISKDDIPTSEIEQQRLLKFPYRVLYGKLNWLAVVCRPDLLYTLSVLGAYLDNFGVKHWIALVEVLQYVKGTIDLKMIYGRNHSKDLKLFAHSDASFANEVDQFRSRSGGVIYLDNTVICCYSRKQTAVATATGTMEAELYATMEMVREIEFFRDLLKNFGINYDDPIPIYVDNVSALHLIRHPTGSKSKFMEARISNIRFQVENNFIKFYYIESPANTADQFTNIRPKPQFEHDRETIGLMKYEVTISAKAFSLKTTDEEFSRWMNNDASYGLMNDDDDEID